MSTYIKDGFICGDSPYHRAIRQSNWASSDYADDVLIFLGIAGGRGIERIAKDIFNTKFLKKAVQLGLNFVSSIVGLGSLGTELNNMLNNAIVNEMSKYLNQLYRELGKYEYLQKVSIKIKLEDDIKNQIINKFTTTISNPHHFHASILYKRLAERCWDRFGDLETLNFAANDEAKKTLVAIIAMHLIFSGNVNSRNSELMNSPYGREHFQVSGWSEFMNSISKYSTYNGISNAIERWQSIGRIVGTFDFDNDFDETLPISFYQEKANNLKQNQLAVAGIALSLLLSLLKK